MADVRPVQAVAERKHERKGAGAEVEEARAGRALLAPTTRHSRRRSRTANTRRAREGTCMQGQSQGNVYFILLDIVRMAPPGTDNI